MLKRNVAAVENSQIENNRTEYYEGIRNKILQIAFLQSFYHKSMCKLVNTINIQHLCNPFVGLVFFY